MASEESISLFSIRNAQLSDLQILAHIVFQAFKTHNESVGLPIDLDFGSVDVAISNVKEKLENPYSEGVVAVNECGRPIALGFIVFGRQVHSINLVAVDPESSRKGVGKAIMLSLLDKANKTAASSVRLTQGANCRSFALYSGLGFFPAEYFNQFVGTINCEQAKSAASSLGMSIDGLAVRPMKLEDVKACSELFKVVLGYDREVEIKQRLNSFPASLWVVTKSETVMGYTTGFDRSGYVIAVNDEACVALYMSAPYVQVFLLGQLYPRLLQWAVQSKLELVRLGSIMVYGEYKRPHSDFVWCPCGLH